MLRDNQTQYICIGGDTETCDGDANSFQLSLDGESAYVFITRPKYIEEQFLRVLDSLPKTRGRHYVVWFHNIAFDLPVLFPSKHSLFRDDDFEFDSHGWHVSGIYSHLCFVTLTKGDKTVQLLGTDSYFKTSLAKLADIYCPHLPKLKPPKDIGKKFYTARDKEFVDYAARDSVVVHVVGTRIIDMHYKYNIPLSVSAPHMASRIFRKMFVEKPIPLPQMSVIYASMHAYHGGKNNFPVKRGLYKGVSCVDIKSAYPFSMSSFPSFSNRDLYFRFHPVAGFTSVPSFGVYNISGMAHLTPWPIIFDHAFKPVYGNFKGIWTTGFELNQALSSKLVTISECYGYYYDAAQDKEPSPFKRYVDHFYVQKESAKHKGDRDFFKLLQNSLYGKFIESRGASSLLNVTYDIDKNETGFSLQLVAGGLFNPFIAALTTGHTRAYIHALEVKYQAIHTATDGIMTRVKNIEGLSNELGGISIEATGDVLLLRNKLYIVYTRAKEKAAKGRDGKALASTIYKGQWIQKYALHGFFADVHTLEIMIRDDIREYEYVKVNKLRESLRRKLKVNRFEKQRRELNLP